MKLKIFIKKIKATCLIWQSKGLFRTILLAPEVEARVAINQILRGKIPVKNVQHDLFVNNMADEILQRITTPQGEPTNDKIEKLLDGAFAQAFWFHSQLAGLTTLWEFRVRAFAQKLGINSNVPISSKSKKNKANKSVQHLKLSDIIKEIDRITSNRLTLKLQGYNELRNAIVHCNPQGMKVYAELPLGKDALSNIRGNVMVLNIDSGKTVNLSEVKSEAAIEEQDTFGWFLEVFSSKLPKRAFEEFEKSITALNQLIEFSAISFD